MNGTNSKREKGKSRIILQERDLHLLRELSVMRVIDREQAKVVAGFGSTTRANSRRLPSPAPDYSGDSFSASAAEGRRSMPCRRKARRPPGSLAWSAPTAGCASRCRLLRRTPARRERHLLRGEVRNDFGSPDELPPLAQLSRAGRSRNQPHPRRLPGVHDAARCVACFLEVDLGHESLAIWKRKPEAICNSHSRGNSRSSSGRPLPGTRPCELRAPVAIDPYSRRRNHPKDLLVRDARRGQRSSSPPSGSGPRAKPSTTSHGTTMKYCYQCGKMTAGEPLYCGHCGRTYDVKLCPRQHVNPRGAEVCSKCGSRELSTPQPKIPMSLRLLALVARLGLGLLLFYASLVCLLRSSARRRSSGLWSSWLLLSGSGGSGRSCLIGSRRPFVRFGNGRSNDDD